MNPPAGSLIAFATDAGHTASDGHGANGLYTAELIKNLATPGLTIEQVFKRTRAGVIAASEGKQMPAEYSRLVGEDGLPSRPASWHLWRAPRVFVPFATIQNWVEAGGEKGAGAPGHRLPDLGVGGFSRVCSRRCLV